MKGDGRSVKTNSIKRLGGNYLPRQGCRHFPECTANRQEPNRIGGKWLPLVSVGVVNAILTTHGICLAIFIEVPGRTRVVRKLGAGYIESAAGREQLVSARTIRAQVRSLEVRIPGNTARLHVFYMLCDTEAIALYVMQDMFTQGGHRQVSRTR